MFLPDSLADYPLEAIIRGCSYYLRARYRPEEYGNLRALDYNCGAGAHALWLAQKGIWVLGVDAVEPLSIAEERAQRVLSEGQRNRVSWCTSMGRAPYDAFDLVLSAYRTKYSSYRSLIFSELTKHLKPGGLFCALVPSLDCASYACVLPEWKEDSEDIGTLVHQETGQRVHHFSLVELRQLLRGFSSVDLLPMRFQLPREESERMGFEGSYWVGQWNIYAVK